MIALLDKPFDPEDRLRAFRKAQPAAGAIVSFAGMVRPKASGAAVTALYLQAHPVLTLRGIQKRTADMSDLFGLSGALVLHRTGKIAPGEAIVLVATAALHRRPAFEAADFLMDYLKTEAIFWKQEITEAGAAWIEPRPEDYKDSSRWTSVMEIP